MTQNLTLPSSPPPACNLPHHEIRTTRFEIRALWPLPPMPRYSSEQGRTLIAPCHIMPYSAWCKSTILKKLRQFPGGRTSYLSEPPDTNRRMTSSRMRF